MSEEDKGFKVQDRRAFQTDGVPREEETPSAVEQDGPTGANAAEDDETCQEKGPGGRCLPPVEFSALILSLSHAALMHLGKVPDPSNGQASVQLDLARHTIDTIAMLKEKTKGNLSDEERNLMDSVLTDLRLTYVRVSK